MEKLNDYFLNLLSNPTFGANDFTLVGLSIDNTSLLDKNTYLNSNYIKNLSIFLTNGEFDQSKFDNFYDYAKKGFTDLAKIKESEDLGNTWMAYRNDISMPDYLRDKRPQFKIERVLNPLRQQSGFVNFGLKENPTLSIREIAQTQLVEDPETGELKESPNNTWFDNFINPKVLATYDEDGTHKDPITGEIVSHKKGDRKLNANGTYYYEDLGNRSVYGKEVLSGFDTLTTDGSFMNKLDFLDSDDVEKSGRGAFMRAAAQIVPAFIPGVNTWYIGARVGLGLAQVLPTVGKMIAGIGGINLDNSFLSKIEAWDKALSFSQSDYVQGSQTDEGLVLLNSHLWSLETGFKLIADVFTQLAEQRWMFEKTSSIFSGLNKEVIVSKEALNKWIEDYISKNSKTPTIEEVLKGLELGEEKYVQRQLLQLTLEWSKALKVLEGKLKGAQELGSKISMAYMTGITTANSFGEMKEQGATDLEAALFTLGYSLAEFGLLNTEMGKWILPELKLERTHMKNVVAKSMEKIKQASKEIDNKTDIGRAKWYSSIFNIGKNMYYNNLGLGIGNEVAGTIVSNMGAEALEETSEELLLDLAKVFYNEAASLLGGEFLFKDAFKDAFDRYALSFIGGAVGGGIAGVLAGTYRQARYDRNMTLEQASREIVDYIQQGKGQELINTVNKMTFSNKYMDELGNLTDDYTKSLDFLVKANFARLVNDILDILTVNGADINTDQLKDILTVKDIRYGMLSSIAAQESNSIMYYINRYNELSTDLVKLSLQLKDLQSKKTDEQKRKEQSESDEEKTLKEQIKLKKEELDTFKNGELSIEFMLDSMFEMTSKVSSIFINNFEQYAEDKYKKSIDELSENELATARKEFEDQKPLIRDLIHKGRQVHIQNMLWLAKMMDEYNETYFKDENEAIANFNEIIFGNRNLINSHKDNSVPLVQSYFAINGNEINEFLKLFQIAILTSLDETKMKPFIDKLKTIEDAYRPFLKRNKIEETLDSFEKIENLPEEQKKKLFELFDVNNIDELKEDFAKEVDGNKVLDTELFNKVILNEDIENRKEQTEEFKALLVNFLMNPEIKSAIIKKLSSAKYMLPSVKVALDLFFDSKLSYIDEAGEPNDDGSMPEISLNKKTIEEYKNSYKDLPSSPVDMYLKNVHRTLKSKGIDLAPTITDLDTLIITLSRARDLETFSYDENIERQIDDALRVILFAKVGLESAATKIDLDLSDAYGFNAAVNLLLEKRKGKGKHQKLAEIRADIAVGIIQDIERYELTLLYYKNLFNYNSNAILNEHDKTYKVQSLNLYNRLKNFVTSIEVPDWDDLDKLKEALEDSDLVEVMNSIKEKKAPNSEEFKKKLTDVRQKLDKAVHNFLVKNNNKSPKDLIKGLTISFTPGKDSYTVLNASEESLSDKDLLWYLAEMSAVDPDILMNEYQSVINANFAPVIGQEEAIKKAVSFLVNPKEFKRFADAWNELVMERYRLEKEEVETKYGKDSKTAESLKNIASSKAANTLVNAYRAIFIEGLPGSGKSSAVLNTIRDILGKHHPKVLEKVVIVSNSKENAKTLTENLGFDADKTQHFGIEEFRNKVMNNYEAPTVLKDGLLQYKDDDTVYDNTRKMRRYAKATLNPDGLDATFLIVDEATSLSLMDAAMFDDWMEAKGIYGLYAGDFDQLGTSGVIHKAGLPISISQGALNYISTHKLGQVIRGNNTYKSNDIISLKINKYDFIHSLIAKGKINPITFTHYIDDTGLYGDAIVRPDLVVTSSGTSNMLDDATKNMIDKMISSLGENEKLNYIFDSPNTLMYKYLEENYKDKINKISTNASQSLEGKYYIVDISLSKDLLNTDTSSIITAERQFNMLYTAVSRAKLGTLIYDENGVISERIYSQQANKLVRSEIGKDSKKDYASKRLNTIISVIPKDTPKSFEKLLWDNEEAKSEEEPDEAHNEEEEKNNEPYIPDIDNSKNGEMNMMIHTFNCHEIGGVIDENGLLVLGEHHKERVDNAHGLVKLLGLTVTDDGKLSVEDTLKIIKAIDEIRAIGTYGESNDIITANIITTLNNIFGKNYRDLVEVRFIYKNSSEPDTLTSKNKLLKFFKSAAEKIRYLFTGETDEAKKAKLETPTDHTIGLEIYVNGKQIDIPVGVLTNPATIIKSKGFELLKDIYDLVRGDSNLGNFTSELKKRKLAGEDIPHLNEMLLLLELYQWRYNHPSRKNFAVRLNKDFVLNLGKITGIQIPPTGPDNITGARGEGYLDEDYYYPGRPVTLEEYRREMPNRNISAVLEGISGDFLYDGKIYIKKGKPFVLMSDYYTNYTDKELYLEYIKEILENKPRKITRVYVNLPKKLDIGYFLWNQQEALKREGNLTKAKDIDYSVGNKLTSFRLLLFMLKENSNFLTAYKNFLETLKADSSFVVDKDSHERSTLDRISRLQQIVQILTDYENSLKDQQKEVLVSDESGVEKKVIETITKKKLFLDFLDLNIESLQSENNELYKLFIPDGALNPDTNVAPIGNTKYSLRTALQFEFRRLLLGGFYLLNGKTVYGIMTPYKPNVQIERDGEEFNFQDFLQDRIDALKKDIEDNNWNGILVNTNLVRNSEMAVSIGTLSYKVAKLQTQNESFVSSESFEFNGKLPTAASIINVAPLLNEILDKAVLKDKDGNYETSEQAKRFSDEDKDQIYLENMGAYLEGRRPSKVRTKALNISKPYNTIINSLEVNGDTTEVQDIVKKYLSNSRNKYNPDASAEELLKLVFENVKNFGILKVGSNFKVIKLNSNLLVVIKPKDLKSFYIMDSTKGNNIYNHNGDLVSLSDLLKLTDLTPEEALIIEDYKNKKLLETKFKVGDELTISILGEPQGDYKIIDILINPEGNIVYLFNDGLTLSQETVDSSEDCKLKDLTDVVQSILDEVTNSEITGIKVTSLDIDDYIRENKANLTSIDANGKRRLNLVKGILLSIIDKYYDGNEIADDLLDEIDKIETTTELIKKVEESGFGKIKISKQQLLTLFNELAPIYNPGLSGRAVGVIDENNCKILI